MTAIANQPGGRDGPLFPIRNRSNARSQWAGAIRRAGIRHLSYHACRHGFATAALHAGIDPVTIARLGGWKSPAHVFATYGHAMADPTLTDRLVDTPATQTTGNDKAIR